jgi:hypothetical protein
LQEVVEGPSLLVVVVQVDTDRLLLEQPLVVVPLQSLQFLFYLETVIQLSLALEALEV